MRKTLVGLTLLAVLSFWATAMLASRYSFLHDHYYLPPLFVFLFDVITLISIIYHHLFTIFPPLRSVSSVRRSILPYSLLAGTSIVASIPILTGILQLYGKSFIHGISYSLTPIEIEEMKFIIVLLAFVFSSLYVTYQFFEWAFRLKEVEAAESSFLKEIEKNGEER